MPRQKNHIDWAEFKGNFALVTRGEALAVIDGYKRRELRRAELRVFAAELEARVLHKNSAVDLYRIVNAKCELKGVRRLSRPKVDAARERVGQYLNSLPAAAEGAPGSREQKVPVPRKFARHIAQGRCSCSEAITLFYYCLRRVRQVKPMRRLAPGQRYARFTYRGLEGLSGIPRANICRAVARLRVKGFLGTRAVAKPNENAYGQLFVDGHQVTLTPVQDGEVSRVCETTTPPRRFDNSPRRRTTTPRKEDPKNTILRPEAAPLRKVSWGTTNPEMLRLVEKANAMLAEQLEQAA